MDKLADLRAKRAEKVEEWNALLFDEKGVPKDDLTDEQIQQAEGFEKEVTELDKKIDRAQKALNAKAATAQPVNNGQGQGQPNNGVKAKPVTDHKAFKGQLFARAVQGIALARLTGKSAEEINKDRFGDNAGPVIAATKALESGQINPASPAGEEGGFLIGEDFVQEIIELLRSASVVMSMNPRVFPMPDGNLTIPAFNTGSAASYVGENTNISKTEPTFRQVTLSAKKLAAIVPVSNDLIRFSTVNSEQAIRDDLIQAMAVKMDEKAIRGDGTSNTPKGLLNLANSNNKFAARDITGTTDLSDRVQKIRFDLGDAELKLLNNDIPMINPGWLMAPRSAVYLADLITEQGAKAFPEMNDGMLRGKPFRQTTNIPINLGSPSQESEVYLVDFAQFVVGESSQMEVSASSEAAYYNGSEVIAAYSQDQTVMRSIARHDFNVRHDSAIAVIQNVEWGI